MTLVTRDDARLVSDIEKLIKKKIDLATLELGDERPRREPRDRFADDERGGAREQVSRDEPPQAAARRAPPSAPRDPFFDRPYEPSVQASSVSSSSSADKAPGAPMLTPNIKPKKKLAALFGARCKEEQSS